MCNLHAQFLIHIIISYHLLTSYHCIIGEIWNVLDSNTWHGCIKTTHWIQYQLCVYTLGGKPWDSWQSYLTPFVTLPCHQHPHHQPCPTWLSSHSWYPNQYFVCTYTARMEVRMSVTISDTFHFLLLPWLITLHMLKPHDCHVPTTKTLTHRLWLHE